MLRPYNKHINISQAGVGVFPFGGAMTAPLHHRFDSEGDLGEVKIF